ncbi:hypothetical protein SAMN05421827_104297 [Pedobacter terrae]|uniref:Uncharacterized protein n=1 Tax=Pedobacter terrae TaxID=405671 RepID=A0A1G7SRU1_9SPHI|nr:hypothetical protein SAMN05421827_104297 [Pedobacter terrae]
MQHLFVKNGVVKAIDIDPFVMLNLFQHIFSMKDPEMNYLG